MIVIVVAHRADDCQPIGPPGEKGKCSVKFTPGTAVEMGSKGPRFPPERPA